MWSDGGLVVHAESPWLELLDGRGRLNAVHAVRVLPTAPAHGANGGGRVMQQVAFSGLSAQAFPLWSHSKVVAHFRQQLQRQPRPDRVPHDTVVPSRLLAVQEAEPAHVFRRFWVGQPQRSTDVRSTGAWRGISHRGTGWERRRGDGSSRLANTFLAMRLQHLCQSLKSVGQQ